MQKADEVLQLISKKFPSLGDLFEILFLDNPDLFQEHCNRWLEDMVQKHGGKFDDSFYQQTISPSVHCFLRIKEEFEFAFILSRRSKSHTSPYLRDEYKSFSPSFVENSYIHFDQRVLWDVLRLTY